MELREFLPIYRKAVEARTAADTKKSYFEHILNSKDLCEKDSKDVEEAIVSMNLVMADMNDVIEKLEKAVDRLYEQDKTCR